MMGRDVVIGWDVGGAHLKACLQIEGRVADVAQWACPLWQGLDRLDAALAAAAARWPEVSTARHAVTMTGEMVDLFPHREAGVRAIAASLAAALPVPPAFFAGDAGWCPASDAGALWNSIASANWLATVQHAARWAEGGAGLLVDIGSTTTDLIAFEGGRVLGQARSDAARLASGGLVYHGVVRTPLCALAPRVPLRGEAVNVMNEFFATTADIYRLTGELDPAHDLHPAADNAVKDLPSTRQRLARMVGLDARDLAADEALALAQAWRGAQVQEIAGQLRRVAATAGLAGEVSVVAAGCGAFLVPSLLGPAGLAGRARIVDYGREVAMPASPALAAWARVCAPAVAVAALFTGEPR